MFWGRVVGEEPEPDGDELEPTPVELSLEEMRAIKVALEGRTSEVERRTNLLTALDTLECGLKKLLRDYGFEDGVRRYGSFETDWSAAHYDTLLRIEKLLALIREPKPYKYKPTGVQGIKAQEAKYQREKAEATGDGEGVE